jgi:hypothetical protein
MSNFSNIGFRVETEEAFPLLLEKAYQQSQAIKVPEGSYAVYRDASGAELWLQFNHKNECIGVNPHYKGKSSRKVCLTETINRPESQLDGSFHGWAEPETKNDPDSGVYPFVFDLPDFRTVGTIAFPRDYNIQLTAFALEISLYASEQEYEQQPDGEPKFASQSFVPSGLFATTTGGEQGQPQAVGIFTGIIKEVERKRNAMTQDEYYWMLVDTLGGEVDVVADVALLEKEPVQGGVVQGQFWLSGQLINPPAREDKAPVNFLRKLFGK